MDNTLTEPGSYIDKAFNDFDLCNVKDVEYVLKITPYYSDLLSDKIFINYIFEKLKKGNAVGDVSNKTTLYKEYKEYFDKNN